MASRRPRRLLVLTSDFSGGTGVHLGRLLESVDPGAWSIHVLSLGERHVNPAPPIIVSDLAPRGPLHRFPLAQAREFRAVRRAVAQYAPDLLHTFFFWSIMYGRALRSLGEVPALVENREDLGFNLVPRAKALLRLTSTVPDCVVAVSGAVASAAAAVEPRATGKIVTIRNGVPLDHPPTSAAERERRRALIGAGPEHFVVGLVAMLNRPVKGIRYFIESMPGIINACPEVRFVIFGDGPDRPTHEAHARALGVEGRLHFAGLQATMRDWYPALDLSVLTSLSEGLSITLLESMAAGVPVCATRVGGNVELVEEEVTGVLVPPADVPAFRDAVIALAGAPARRAALARAARARVEREFSIETVARRYEAVWDGVSGRHEK